MKTKSTKIKKSLGERIFQVAAHIIIAFLALICFYPFWYVVVGAFSNPNLLDQHSGILLAPIGFDLDSFKKVFELDLLLSGFANSLLLLGVGIPLNVMMTSFGAYFFSKKNILFKDILFKYCLLTMYISGGMIPLYLNFQELGMIGNRWGVLIGFCISCYYMIILRTAFSSIPESLCDAARIDGAGHFTTMFKVIIPLSKASIAVIAMYYGVGIWNGWFWSTMLTGSQLKWPLQAVLRTLLIEANVGGDGVGVKETVRYATIVVSVLPVLFIYPTLQKYFTKGVLVGAVKG